MFRLFIYGAAGYTNLGDDAILEALLSQLRAAFGTTLQVTVAGGDRAELAAKHHTLAVDADDWARVASELQRAEANVIEGLIVDAKGFVGIFDQLMDREGGIVRLNHCVRYLIMLTYA